MIQSIPTSYAGMLFRSKLEARWAEFLDDKGIRWEYEPRTFMTTLGGYLPDFWLPDQRLWAEVKPMLLDADALRKLMDVVDQTGDKALLLEGSPSARVRMIRHSGHMQALHQYRGLHVVSHWLSSETERDDSIQSL